MAPEEAEQRRRRMRAALALAGLTVEDLAARIDLRGYGAKSLYNMQSGSDGRVISDRDIRELARGTGVAEWFFTADFSADPSEDVHDDVAALRRDLQTLAQAVVEMASGGAAAALGAARQVASAPPHGTARDVGAQDQ